MFDSMISVCLKQAQANGILIERLTWDANGEETEGRCDAFPRRNMKCLVVVVLAVVVVHK